MQAILAQAHPSPMTGQRASQCLGHAPEGRLGADMCFNRLASCRARVCAPPLGWGRECMKALRQVASSEKRAFRARPEAKQRGARAGTVEGRHWIEERGSKKLIE